MGKWMRALVALCAFAAIAADAPSKSPADATLENLQKAYRNECNAQARYRAFAKKADAEGYEGAASLFRAAARAEQIHASNHAVVIRGKGAAPMRKAVPPGTRTTLSNLQTAVNAENYERDKVYPVFLSQAESVRDRPAVRTFRYALKGETAHADVYAAALANPSRLKAGKKDVYVCPVCGYVTLDGSVDKCPTCSAARRRFEKVN